MTRSKPSPNSIALAGEFASLSQLTLRGYDANLTLGNTKNVDILVSDPSSGHMYRLEVKTTGVPMSRWRRRKAVSIVRLQLRVALEPEAREHCRPGHGRSTLAPLTADADDLPDHPTSSERTSKQRRWRELRSRRDFRYS